MKAGGKYWWAYADNKLDIAYRELFTMFKGYRHAGNMLNAKLKDSHGHKLKDDDAEAQYKEWKNGLMKILKPYKNFNYSENDIKWMKDYLSDLAQEYSNQDLMLKCPLNQFGLPQWLQNYTNTFNGYDELLNPYWLYVCTKYPNGYGLGYDRYTTSSYNLDKIKARFPQFQFRVYVDIDNIV